MSNASQSGWGLLTKSVQCAHTTHLIAAATAATTVAPTASRAAAPTAAVLAEVAPSKAPMATATPAPAPSAATSPTAAAEAAPCSGKALEPRRNLLLGLCREGGVGGSVSTRCKGEV